MSVISGGKASVQRLEGVTCEGRGVIYDIHNIDVYARDISELIRTSCLPSSKAPLGRIVSNVLITAGKAIEALGCLECDRDTDREYQHTHRTIRFQPLKGIEDEIFIKEVNRGIHSVKIADQVCQALRLIRGEFDRNKGIIAGELDRVVKSKEYELSSLLHLPLDVKKLRRFEKGIDDLLCALIGLNPTEEDVGSIDTDYYRSPFNQIKLRLDGILKYLQLLFIVEEVENLDLSTQDNFERFYFLTDIFNDGLSKWKKIPKILRGEHAGLDCQFDNIPLIFAEDLQGIFVSKFFTNVSFFSKIVEHMKELTGIKYRWEFSIEPKVFREDRRALDSEASRFDQILAKAGNFLTCFSGTKPNNQKQLVFIAGNIKRYLIDPLVHIKRGLRDSFDLDTAEILIDYKKDLLNIVRDHKALKEGNALVEGAVDLVSLCAFFEVRAQNLVDIIDKKLSEIVIDQIAENTLKMNLLLEEEGKNSDWRDRMEKFCDQLCEFRNHRFISSLSEPLQKRMYVEMGRVYWTCCLAIGDYCEDLETLEKKVDLLARNQRLLQAYTSELEKIGEIDADLDHRIRSSYARRVAILSEEIVRSLERDMQAYGDEAMEYAEAPLSRDVASRSLEANQKYKAFQREALSILSRINREDALTIDLISIKSIFSCLVMEFSLSKYLKKDVESTMDKFLSKQEKALELSRAGASVEGSWSKYQAKFREKLAGVQAIISSLVGSYEAFFFNSLSALSADIEKCSFHSEAETTPLFKNFRERIEALDGKYREFMSRSSFGSSDFAQLGSSIKRVKRKFEKMFLQGMESSVKSLADSMLTDLTTTPEASELWITRIETFYSQHIIPMVFEEEGCSPEAAFLFREKERMLKTIRTISDGRVVISPEIRDMTSPVGRVGSTDLSAAQETPTSEALGVELSPSPTRPPSSFRF